MRFLRRAAVLVFLGLTLGVPGASLAKARSEKAPSETSGATLNVFDLLSSLSRFLTRLGFKEGCTIDPLGHCMASDPTPDAGWRIDSLGCTRTQDSEAGCTIDPLGTCAPGH